MLTLTRPEQGRILGHFSAEFRERIRSALLVEQVRRAVDDGSALMRQAFEAGLIPSAAFLRYLAERGISPIAGGANAYYVTNAEAISMLTDYGVGIDSGTAAVIQIYSGSVPADADAANGGTLLATLTCSATAFASVSDDTPGALATFDTITDDSSADNTGTATFFRISTQSGGTVKGQGTVGTGSGYDLLLNTDAITSGSTVSITSATILLPEGP